MTKARSKILTSRRDIANAVEALTEGGFRTSVQFNFPKRLGRRMLPSSRVKATIIDKIRGFDIRLNIGRLNYEEKDWATRQLRLMGRVPKFRSRR